MDRVLNEEHLYEKKQAQNVHQKLIPGPFLILVKNPEQSVHARNSSTNQIF